MFRHQGKTRTLSHNLQIASLLSLVAGMVNVTGFFAVNRLTTNVTGHFAYFVDEVSKLHFWQAFTYFLYTFCFCFGSFVSNFLIEFISSKNDRYIYSFPASFELILLIVLGCANHKMVDQHPDIIACSLLFAMGLQNSLVTTLSNASVRTTHLTGLFTDLGIELSQLFFYKAHAQKEALLSSIKLRLTIISCFFIGGVIGGVLFVRFSLKTLFAAAIILAFGLIYDNIRYRIILLSRRFRTAEGSV